MDCGGAQDRLRVVCAFILLMQKGREKKEKRIYPCPHRKGGVRGRFTKEKTAKSPGRFSCLRKGGPGRKSDGKGEGSEPGSRKGRRKTD